MVSSAPRSSHYSHSRRGRGSADLGRQPGRDRITVAHVLGMTLGTEWDELTIPYGSPSNSAMAMELSRDCYRFLLERPIVGRVRREVDLQWRRHRVAGPIDRQGMGEKL